MAKLQPSIQCSRYSLDQILEAHLDFFSPDARINSNSGMDWDFAAATMLVVDVVLVASYVVWLYTMKRLFRGQFDTSTRG